VVAAQSENGKKTNEVPMATVVLGQIDLANKIVTADALHTVKATARHIHEHGGEFVLPVKKNPRALFDALDALPWDQAPIASTAIDRGHGRITTRTIQVLPAPEDLPSRTSARCSSSSGTSLTCTASRSRPSPHSASPARHLNKVAPLLAPECRSWPREQLRSGKAFVMIDGVDGVPQTQRPAVLAWVNDLAELFPEARYVVTTRPGAIESEALEAAGFVFATLNPMDPAQIRTFVDRWHSAMWEWQKDVEFQEQLKNFRNQLLKTLENDRFLIELANTPLLAGLICALNQHLNAQLPRRRSEIFEKALAMLYERDRKRGVASDIALDFEATFHLLGDLALWMIRNGVVETAADSARDVLRRSANSLPDMKYSPVELYRHLLLRSGLLREPTAEFVDFVHRTFHEYLAARALIDSDNVGEVIKNASDDQWHEVVIVNIHPMYSG